MRITATATGSLGIRRRFSDQQVEDIDLGGANYQIIGNAFDVSRSALSLNPTKLLLSNKSKRRVLPESLDKYFEHTAIRKSYLRCSGIDAPAAAVSYSEFTRKLSFIHTDVSYCAVPAIRTSWRYLGWRGHLLGCVRG